MKVSQFLKKYGNEKVSFTNLYKHGIVYSNETFKVSGIVEYRGDFEKEMTIKSFYNEITSFRGYQNGKAMCEEISY